MLNPSTLAIWPPNVRINVAYNAEEARVLNQATIGFVLPGSRRDGSG
jgi:hypothetical protein